MQIDDFLAHHDDIQIDAALEPIPDDLTRVRFTPVLGGACACSRSLVIDKNYIVDVEPTGRAITCCGKLRRIARVVLRADTRIPAGDVIAGMLARPYTDADTSDRPDPDDPRRCQEEAIRQYKVCVNGCRDTRDPEACRARCRAQLAEDLEICYGNG